MVRSIVAVLVAPIVWGIVMFPGNLLLAKMFPGAETNPTTTYLVCAIVASVVYSLLAGVVTALIARARPVVHGVWAGIVLLAVGVFVQLQFWDQAPIWYHLTFLVLLVPGCALGGYWLGRSSGRASTTE